ncbi:hypothetical protein HJC99_01035 [Candidatus Saccharibacteria bacterium]|nr:hypothetical protein [Candidatus Saccharibacteria bacterium]
MTQTFDDMLAGEPNHLARMAIWGRALVDLPASAAKEHLTNGVDMNMGRNLKIIIGGVIAALVIGNIASFWVGNLHARRTQGIQQVSVAQLADAMQQDGFYSSYGDATVLFTATVASTQQNNGVTLATFVTGRPYAVTCQFTTPVSVGQTLGVAAPGGSAERQTKGVLLHGCAKTS